MAPAEFSEKQELCSQKKMSCLKGCSRKLNQSIDLYKGQNTAVYVRGSNVDEL